MLDAYTASSLVTIATLAMLGISCVSQRLIIRWKMMTLKWRIHQLHSKNGLRG